jgi:hypothetical protein
MPTATESAALRRQEGRIGEALVRLNRAVQRASIYPPGHPAIPAAVKAFVESLGLALAEQPVLLVGVAADRLVVEGVSLDERRTALSWLTEQLRERALASFAIDRGVTEGELVRFVEWLAYPLPPGKEGKSEGEAKSFAGIALARIDYGKARFVDSPSAKAQDPTRLWETLASSLTAGWYFDDRPLPDDPEALARELSAHVLRNEGLGGAALLARIEATGGHLRHLPDAVRTSMKQRLSAFVSGLTPDLRSQLLRVDKDTSRLKVEFLSEVMDDLPDTLVLEILADIDLGGGPPPRHLLNLFNKLIGVAAIDPLSRDLAEAKLQSLGLPAGLTGLSPAKVESALREVLDVRGDYSNPEKYQERLETLSGEGPGDTMHYDSRHYEDPRDPLLVRTHVSSIVLRLLVAAPDRPEAADQVRRLLAELPRDVAAGRFDAIYERTTALDEVLARPGGVADDVRLVAAEYRAQAADPGLVAALLQAAEEGSGPPSAGMVALFRAAGLDGACAAFDRLAELPPGEGHDRLCELLFLLDAEALNAAVAHLRATGSGSLRALFDLLRHPGSTLGPDLGLTFIASKDEGMRLEAFRWLLGGAAAAAQFPRLLGKALADPDAQIVALGIERAAAVGGKASARALGEFLSGWLAGGMAPELGKRATFALAGLPGPEAGGTLRGLLLTRRTALSIAAVRRSMVLEAGLIRLGDDDAVAAVRSFRRSPAGWISMLLPEPVAEPAERS